ncbi:hypothetical protein ANANG_G00068500 [Anguilla anguilla]|uniref:Delta-sarcoglycan n=2 Tax=Anguilla anguilla TaxID=7936 RepID=A0A9D3S5U0_ANGAN|nr:hypothetical protein ANANG_G00068500 [Anguilla anguilla]
MTLSAAKKKTLQSSQHIARYNSLKEGENRSPLSSPDLLASEKEMTQEHFAQRNDVQASEKQQFCPAGISGWRKRCLYFFLLLLMILILVNLALTIWILKVMNFTIDGMGNLRITPTGLELAGDSEFLQPLYAKEIQSRPGSPLLLQSSRNVSINILDGRNVPVTQLVTGSSGVRACSKLLEVKSNSGKLLFSADDREIVVGADRLRVPGAEGAVFSRSVETPHVRAEPFKELRLESPTRSLFMEAPKGVQLLAEAGDIQATCRNEMRLESKDGQITLDASRIKLPRLPQGQSSSAGPKHAAFEACVCPNGRLFISQAGTGSTCLTSTSICQ